MLNGRTYRRPRVPTVIVCADGCDPAYIERGFADGILPAIAAFREAGFVGEAEAAMPSFTNPNNLSIVTGAPPAVHGISVLSRPLVPEYRRRAASGGLRNFDIFDFALNGLAG